MWREKVVNYFQIESKSISKSFRLKYKIFNNCADVPYTIFIVILYMKNGDLACGAM